VYQARFGQEETQRRLVGDLLDRAFGGSAAKLVLQALAARRATPEDLREIRALIDSKTPDSKTPDSETTNTKENDRGRD
jgi:predicted transcriptional regulator